MMSPSYAMNSYKTALLLSFLAYFEPIRYQWIKLRVDKFFSHKPRILPANLFEVILFL